MNFIFEYQVLGDMVVCFVVREFDLYVFVWEKVEQFLVYEVFKKFGDLGLLGLKYLEVYGGQGLDFSYLLVMVEVLGGCYCVGVLMVIGVQMDMCMFVLVCFGLDELWCEFLMFSIVGDYVGCVGVFELGGGLDVVVLKIMVCKDGGDYVISGSKMWIINGMQVDWCCLFVNIGEGLVYCNKSLIIVLMDVLGIMWQKIYKIGMDLFDIVQFFFDSVCVLQCYLIGQEGMGFIYQMMQFQEEWLWVVVLVLKNLDWLIDLMIVYICE